MLWDRFLRICILISWAEECVPSAGAPVGRLQAKQASSKQQTKQASMQTEANEQQELHTYAQYISYSEYAWIEVGQSPEYGTPKYSSYHMIVLAV